MQTFTKKVGDTLSFVLTVSEDGTPLDLTGYTLTSELRSGSARTLVATMVCTLGDQVTSPGQVEVVLEDSSDLDPGRYVADLRYDLAGVSTSTETWIVILDSAVTARPEP